MGKIKDIKEMKKVILLAIILIITISLYGCTKENEATVILQKVIDKYKPSRLMRQKELLCRI